MSTQTIDQRSAQRLRPAYWAALVLVYLLVPVVLWLCAGTLDWWQSWVFALLIVAVGIVTRFLMERRTPGLLAERSRGLFGNPPDVKPWDRVLSRLMAVSISFPLVIVAGLDHRFGWSPAFAPWLTIVGLLVVAAGYALGAWAAVENRFFSGVVRIQQERGHVVCDSGPYRMVRHPGYAGNTLALPGVALALGSLWTLLPAAAALVIAVLRTALEDRMLQDELPGYRAYARRVRYRLLPGVW